MSSSMEQPTTTTPKRPRNKAPRKEGSSTVQDGTADVTVIPNSKDSHEAEGRHPIAGIISLPSVLDQVIPSLQALDLDLHQSPSTQKKKKNYGKRKYNDRVQQEQSSSIVPQSVPSEEQQAPLDATPVKVQQRYAGPTFHSSPAASSLPMPKFFTQSTMKTAKPVEPTPTVSDEESSSQDGGDSLTLKSSLKVLGNPDVRVGSPLDIFFNADRQEKAGKGLLDSRLPPERAQSASPANNAFRSPPPATTTTTTPSAGEGNYAKTLALRQLLLFPRAQSYSQSSENVSASPFLDIENRPGLGRSTSETSTPTRSSVNSNDSPVGKRPFYDSPSLSTPPSSARSNRTRRPLPHHLRQEFLNSLPLDQSPDVSSKSDYLSPKSKA